jgi:hypothetical protein
MPPDFVTSQISAIDTRDLKEAKALLEELPAQQFVR